MNAYYVIIPVVVALLLWEMTWRRESDREHLETMITCTFLGHPTEGVPVAVQGGLAEQLCKPFTADMLRQVRTCREIRRAEIKARWTHPLWDHLRVTYDFEGVGSDGQVVIVKRDVELRMVCSHLWRNGFGPLVVTQVECIDQGGEAA